ncbi:MAG: VWA domain-containing protein [Terrimonas sp.]|nr:VWA domain-containing protein [Terrimonas sp.]
MPRKYLMMVTMLALAVTAFLSFRTTPQKLKSFKLMDGMGDTTIPGKPDARGFEGKTTETQLGVIRFKSALDNDYYLKNAQDHEAYFYLEAKMGDFKNDIIAKVPLNIAIVIDRSGSMSGDKISYAKKAAEDIIQRLSPDDYVSVIVYDDEVDLIQASIRVTDKEAILAKIRRIETGGSTNLWGGTEKGFEQVRSGYKNRYVNRVLLISDGLANVGLTSQFEIRKRVSAYREKEGITLSTFGVGLDYNEILMTDMAESGNGNYYFISAPDKMASLFEKELNGLLNVAAQNAEIRIQLPRGISIQKGYGVKYEEYPGEIRIQLRDLFSEETKGCLFKIAIDSYADVPLQLQSTLSYDDVMDQKRKTMTHENKLLPTTDKDVYTNHFNEWVLAQSVLYRANENMENAMLEADKGNYAKARDLVRDNQVFLSDNKSYVEKSEELKKMEHTNTGYYSELKNAETMSSDSVKYMQKSNRASSYKIRTKKSN